MFIARLDLLIGPFCRELKRLIEIRGILSLSYMVRWLDQLVLVDSHEVEISSSKISCVRLVQYNEKLVSWMYMCLNL